MRYEAQGRDRLGAMLILESMSDNARAPILDLGAGDGAIGLRIAQRLGGPVVLVEIDPNRAKLARHQLASSGCEGRVVCGDYFGQLDLPKYPFRCIVSNPPQLPTEDDTWSVADCGGRDGLSHIERIAELGERLSKTGAQLYLHLLGFLPVDNYVDRRGVRRILESSGYSQVRIQTEEWVPVRPNGATVRELRYITRTYGTDAFRVDGRRPACCSTLFTALSHRSNVQVLRRVVMATRGG